MKRIEPNLLLAIATAIPLILLIMTASLFGEPGQTLKYVILTVVCTALYVVLNGIMAKRLGRQRPSMIHPDAPSTALWASLFPLILMILAAVPFFFAGHDYGLLIIIAAILFAGTVESALKARKGG